MRTIVLTIWALLAMMVLAGSGRQPVAPPTIRVETLKGLVVVPERWYAGYHLRAKLTKLWELRDPVWPLTIRVTPKGSAPYERYIHPKDSEPFLGAPPGWNDFSFDCGVFPEGKATVTLKVEVFQESPRDGEHPAPLASVEVTKDTVMEASLDALGAEPFLDKIAAAKITASFEDGLRIKAPDEFKAAFAVSVRVLHNQTLIATASGYNSVRDPGWDKAGTLGLGVGSLSDSPLELTPTAAFEGERFPDGPLVVEIAGDSEVALRAGFKKYWAGRIVLKVR